MSIIEGLIIFIALLLIYGISVYVLHKKGWLKKHHISLYGPALMWRTEKGITFLKKRAKRERFWKVYGNISIVFCFITMILMTLLIIGTAWLVSGFTAAQKEALPGIETALVLPVINPILPLEYVGYVILALVIAMIVHEFSHGILTLVHKLKVKSLGLLYLIVPIGAFCEPDDEEVKKAKIKPRMQLYAAGPCSNFIVVLASLLLISLVCFSAVQPAADGAQVFIVETESPADHLGIQPGSIITAFNDTPITSSTEYFTTLNHTHANQTVSITYNTGGVVTTSQVTLNDTYIELSKRTTEKVNVSYKGKGYLGIHVFIQPVYKEYLATLKNPLTNFPQGLLTFYSIPVLGYFTGYNPIVAPFTNSYVLTGPLSFIPGSLFWIFINALYWIFWLNFAVALFNVLPMVPLDGGFLFNDGIRSIIGKVKKELNEEQREKIVKNISLVLSLTILILVFFPWIVKYLFPG